MLEYWRPIVFFFVLFDIMCMIDFTFLFVVHWAILMVKFCSVHRVKASWVADIVLVFGLLMFVGVLSGEWQMISVPGNRSNNRDGDSALLLCAGPKRTEKARPGTKVAARRPVAHTAIGRRSGRRENCWRQNRDSVTAQDWTHELSRKEAWGPNSARKSSIREN